MDTAASFDLSSLFVTREQLLAARAARTRIHLIDVRKPPAFASDPRMVQGALHCPPNQVGQWAEMHSSDRAVVVYCVYGHAVSQSAAQQLRALGFQAWALAGGFKGGEDGADDATDIARWRSVDLPIAPSLGTWGR
jgi:rhodanese-related sulfurtransferase